MRTHNGYTDIPNLISDRDFLGVWTVLRNSIAVPLVNKCPGLEWDSEQNLNISGEGTSDSYTFHIWAVPDELQQLVAD